MGNSLKKSTKITRISYYFDNYYYYFVACMYIIITLIAKQINFWSVLFLFISYFKCVYNGWTIKLKKRGIYGIRNEKRGKK